MATRGKSTELLSPGGDVKVITKVDDGVYDRGGLFGIFKSKRGRVDESGNIIISGTTTTPDEFGGNKVEYVEWEESDTGGNETKYSAGPADDFGTNPVRYEETTEVPEVRRLAE